MATSRVLDVLAFRGRPLVVRIAVVVVPAVVVALAFGWATVTIAVRYAAPLDEAQRLAVVSDSALALVGRLQDERDLAAPAVDVPRAELGLDDEYEATERDLAAFEAALAKAPGNVFAAQLAPVRAAFADLARVRDQAYRSAMPPVAANEAYARIVLAVVNLGARAESRATLLSHSGAVQSRSAGLYDLVLAQEAASQRRALVSAVLARGRVLVSERDALLDLGAAVRVQVGSFAARARPDALTLLAQRDVDRAGRSADAFVRRVLARDAGDPFTGLTVSGWQELSTRHLDGLRAVVRDGSRGMITDVRVLLFEGRQAVAANVATVVGAVLLVVLLAVGVARGLLADLRRVKRGMLTVAYDSLPGVVRRLSTEPVGTVDAAIDPVGPDTRDEIGRMAAAFDAVHREAVRLAATQARMRATMTVAFSTVTARAQQLIGRQLALISELERNQVDPDKLDALFRLDHLATRIRRYSDVLLVLADEDPGRCRTEPALLAEVVQAASAEIDQYARVEPPPQLDVIIKADAIVDTVHLLAELLDNATKSADDTSAVNVFATSSLDGSVLVEVVDDGAGMPAEELNALNSRLAGPPRLDATVDERAGIGLFIVHLLAARHGIRVRLSSRSRGGTTVSVLLPAAITAPKPADWVEQSGGQARSGTRLIVGGVEGPAAAAPSVPSEPVSASRR